MNNTNDPEFYRAAIEEGFLPKRVGGGTFNVPVVYSPRQYLVDWVTPIPLPDLLCSDEATVNAETSTDPVQNHIDLVTDDLRQGRTTPDQRRSLKGAVERADRVAPASDQAFRRIVGKG